MDDVRAFLQILGWGERVMWPREVGLHRARVRDPYEFYAYVERCLQFRSHCYVSLFGEVSLLLGDLRKFVIDIDFHDRDLDVEELGRMAQEMVGKLRYLGLLGIVVTGRGLHIYFAVDPELVRELGWKVYARRMAQWIWREVLDGHPVDMQVVGDVRRLVRVAGTWNRDRAAYVAWRTESPVVQLPEQVREYLRSGPSVVSLGYVPDPKADKHPFPPCIVKMVNELVQTGELDHFGRVIVASYLLNVRGWSEEAVAEIFRAASDYNERITNYQVSHIKRGGYLPPSCERVWELGHCPFLCQFWPWMGRRG